MTWARIDDRFFFNPKVIICDGDTKLLYLAGLTYAAGELTDGQIPRGALPLIGIMAGVANAQANAECLLKAGLWFATPDGYTIHDYLKYNPSKDKVISVRDARKEAGSKGGQASLGKRRQRSEVANAQAIAERLLKAEPKQNSSNIPSPITSKEGAEAPPTKEPKEKTKGVNLAPLYAAFTAAGLERPIIPKQEHKVAGDLLEQVGPDALVGIWMDIGKGVWPPDDKTHWMLNNRSFSTIAPRINNWIDFKNGRHVKLAAGKECKDWVD